MNSVKLLNVYKNESCSNFNVSIVLSRSILLRNKILKLKMLIKRNFLS